MSRKLLKNSTSSSTTHTDHVIRGFDVHAVFGLSDGLLFSCRERIIFPIMCKEAPPVDCVHPVLRFEQRVWNPVLQHSFSSDATTVMRLLKVWFPPFTEPAESVLLLCFFAICSSPCCLISADVRDSAVGRLCRFGPRDNSFLICSALFQERRRKEVDLLFLTCCCLSGCRPWKSAFATFLSDLARAVAHSLSPCLYFGHRAWMHILHIWSTSPFDDHCLQSPSFVSLCIALRCGDWECCFFHPDLLFLNNDGILLMVFHCVCEFAFFNYKKLLGSMRWI